MKKLFIVLVLLASEVLAQCSGSTWHYLPAVVGDKGILVNVSLTLENGNGDIYISVYPKVGISTQQSAREAVDYAFIAEGRNRNECDVRIKAYLSDGGGYIDGPSGGAALTLMSIAALEGKQMRNDAILTGTIEADGKIGTVGGLYEKIKIASENGLKYFLSPRQKLYERLMLRMIQDETGIMVLEVENISEAKAFLINRKEIETKRKPPSVEQINESIPAYIAERPEFKKLAEEMMVLLRQSKSKIDSTLMEKEMLNQYFEQIDKNEEILLEKGYYFSAANDAFVNYLDAETIANVEKLDVQARAAQINECLRELKQPELTDANVEWVAGSELRSGWALKKLDETAGKNATLKEEKYIQYHEMMYADAWCRIAAMLNKNAPQGGKVLDESVLENLSMEYIKMAKANIGEDAEMMWHLENAQKLHSEGKYMGAIIDSVFTIEIVDAKNKFDKDREAAMNEMSKLSLEKRKSLWGDVYAGHGALLAIRGDNETAYSLFRLAKGLDVANIKMMEKLQKTKNGQIRSKDECTQQKQQLQIYLVVVALLAVITSLGMLYVYLSTKQKTNFFKTKKRN